MLLEDPWYEPQWVPRRKRTGKICPNCFAEILEEDGVEICRC